MNHLTTLTPELSELHWLPGSLRLIEPHRLAGQQPDNLCGPYWVSLLLNAFEVSQVDSTQVAKLAGSLLPVGDDPTVWVPPGAVSRQDYTAPLLTSSLERAGTSALGLVNAVHQASSRQYTLVPLKTRWTGNSLEAVLQLCWANPQWEAVPLCNVRTGHLWGSRLSLAQAIAYLQGVAISPPAADWNVGHFVTLAGQVEGMARSLVIVRDTYPTLGWDGYHLQPSEAIATALNRDDGSEGGVFLFVATHHQAEVEQQCQQQGWAIALWNNGTPYEGDRVRGVIG